MDDDDDDDDDDVTLTLTLCLATRCLGSAEGLHSRGSIQYHLLFFCIVNKSTHCKDIVTAF